MKWSTIIAVLGGALLFAGKGKKSVSYDKPVGRAMDLQGKTIPKSQYPWSGLIGKVGNWRENKDAFLPAVKRVAAQYGYPWRLMAAQISAESGFYPYALSYVGAAGMCQFMPDTARGWGLKVEPGCFVVINGRKREFPVVFDRSLDERFSPDKIMVAQARLMRRNHEYYRSQGANDRDSWDLALAAYLSGRGNTPDSVSRLSAAQQRYINKIREREALM